MIVPLYTVQGQVLRRTRHSLKPHLGVQLSHHDPPVLEINVGAQVVDFPLSKPAPRHGWEEDEGKAVPALVDRDGAEAP
jgi:hypothetical protein